MVLKLLTICLLLLSTLGCTRDLHTTGHLSKQHHLDQYAVLTYPGTWEYRYGESPKKPDGSLLFADPSLADSGWKQTRSPYIPEGRGEHEFLWLRTRLVGPPLSDPALFFQSVNQSYKAYLDGTLIAAFGEMEGERARRFSGEPRAYLPLVPPLASLNKGSAEHTSYVGRVLTLQIYSPHRYIGVFGPILIGARTSILATQVQKGISVFVVALILMAIGLIALVLFALRYKETVYLYYGLFTISTGVHFLSRTSLHELLFHAPAAWGASTLFALPVVASSMCAFIWKTLGRGPYFAMPILAGFFSLFFVIAALVVGMGHENPWQILLPLQIAMLLGIVIQVVTLTLAAWRGDTNARILSIGTVVCAAAAVVDILAAMNLLDGQHNLNSHYGVAGLVLALAVVLARRFVRLTLMTDRAARLEQESAQQALRLAEQSNLLAAAARMAKGDLASEISVPAGNELTPLALALDSMRQDLKRKLTQLEQNNLAIRGLNDELRRQIEQRSRRLMETVAQGLGNAPQRPVEVAPGKRLGDHYQVLATIGSGAMGTVFEVERTTDHKRFAAKVLTEARKKTSLLRFAREAQILCRLDHPNLISIVDIDVTKDGVVFLVMELVRGTVLKAWKEKFGDLGFAIDVLKQMTGGLSIIHKSGIVHRDACGIHKRGSTSREGSRHRQSLGDRIPGRAQRPDAAPQGICLSY